MKFRLLSIVILISLLAGCRATPTLAPAAEQPALATVTPPGDSAPTPRPLLTVRPTTEADAYAFEQNKRLGRGVNLGNALEAPEEGDWGMTLDEDFFRIIKEGGFDSIRVPIRWNAHADEKAPYSIDLKFYERVDWVVSQAKKNNLNVILDWHHYLELMDSPGMHKERYLAIWEQIAQHYANEPESVYFELLNEPNGTLSANGSWNTIQAEAIAVIRESNPTRTLIVTGGDWSAFASLYMLELPEDDRNLIVTFHYYLPFMFTHQGADWVDGSNDWMGTTWAGEKSHQSAISRDFDTAAMWSAKNGRPLFLGEFGAYSKADMDSRARWTNYVAREAEKRGFSWAYWEFGAGFGVYDRALKSWVQPIHDALIP
jgi:endoglucanase